MKKTFEFSIEERSVIGDILESHCINESAFGGAIDRIEQIVSERITKEQIEQNWKELENSGLDKPFVPITPESGESGQSAEDVLMKEYNYAKQFAILVHARCYPEVTQWEPLPDLMGLLTQIDNMVCGLERKVEADTEAADDILRQYAWHFSRFDGEPFHVVDFPDALKAMTTYASQVCADKDREIQRLNDKIQGIQEFMDKRRTQREQLESELYRLNESLTVMLRKNAELELELEYAKIR